MREIFPHIKEIGRVRELLINAEKASTSSIFEGDIKSFLCLRFSITHAHYQEIFYEGI
jgi:hypothetical protein